MNQLMFAFNNVNWFKTIQKRFQLIDTIKPTFVVKEMLKPKKNYFKQSERFHLSPTKEQFQFNRCLFNISLYYATL